MGAHTLEKVPSPPAGEAAAGDDVGTPHVLAGVLCGALERVADGLQKSASRLGQAFLVPTGNNAATTGLAESLIELVARSRANDTGTLAGAATTTFAEMDAQAAVIEATLREVLAGATEVEVGIRRVLARVVLLRRLAAVSRFLATCANMENAHVEGGEHLGFGLAGQRIADLVKQNLVICDEVDEACGRLAGRVGYLAHNVHVQLQEVRDYRKKLMAADHRARVLIVSFETEQAGRLRTLARAGDAVAADIHGLQRGLQFEDMASQLITSISRKLRGEVRSGHQPVAQASLDAGTVELF